MLPRVDPNSAAAEMRAVGLEPLEPYRNVGTPWRCRCTRCGHEVAPKLSHIRAGASSGCKYCSGTAVHPDDATAELAGMELDLVGPWVRATAPVAVRCQRCGTESTVTLSTLRTGKAVPCRACWTTPKRTPHDEAVAVMRSGGFEPHGTYPGMDVRWPATCLTCGRESHPFYSAVRRGHGCKWCKKMAVDPDEAAEVMRAAGFEPLEPYHRANRPWRCRCTNCGLESSPRYNSVANKSTACRGCAPHGFTPSKPAVVYLLTHPEMQAHKIGIANRTKSRIEVHRRAGWEVVEVMDCSGPEAWRIERAVLAWWRRDLGLPPAVPRTVDGASETVAADALTTETIWAYVATLRGVTRG
jgi:hypothetical protein